MDKTDNGFIFHIRNSNKVAMTEIPDNLPKCAGTGPLEIPVEKGRLYSWCTCGLSVTQPLCDGAHKNGTSFKSLKFEAEKDGTVWLCTCKRTKTPPYCDGSHNTVPAE